MENTEDVENSKVPERRRRRKRISTGDSEDLSDASVDDKKKESEPESELEPGVLAESEYESAEEEDEDGASEEGGGEALSDDVIIEGYEGEREEGDGEEESSAAKEKALDDDEDRRNPQYIPKKGTFYEHDDRTVADEEDDKKPEEETEDKTKRRVWKEHEDRWMHDRYNEDDQAPKSRDELVAIYGYDIRNEEGAPRARRRRRYGRGPNKYTRTWEDEFAYAKMASRGGGGGERGGGGGRGRGRRTSSEEGLDVEEKVEGESQKWGGRGREFRRSRNGEREDEKPFRGRTDNRRSRGRGRGAFGGQGRRLEEPEEDFPPLIPHSDSASTKEVVISNVKETLETKSVFKETVYSEAADKKERETQTEPPPWKPRGRGKFRGGILPNVRTNIGSGGLGKGPQHDAKGRGNVLLPGSVDVPTTTLTFVNSSARVHEDSLNHEFSNLNIDEADDYLAVQQQLVPLQTKEFKKSPRNSSGYHQQSDRRQTVVPPRLQDGAANRSKRYSSQRQRVITDTPPPTSNFNQNPSGYYETGFPQQVFTEPPPQPPPPVPTSPPQIIPPATFAPPYPSPPAYPETFIPPPQPTGAPMFAPPQTINAPPVVPPAPPFIAPNATLINYVPPPAQFTPAPFPSFQGFPSPPQPQEVYQGPGITYYNTHNQIPRPTPLKRPKAAIPIVPPPEKEMDSMREREDRVEDSILTEVETNDYQGDVSSCHTPTNNDSTFSEQDDDNLCVPDASENAPQESIECRETNNVIHQQQVTNEVAS